ncbi:MAG: toprim domain-containing protein [Acidimicrobiales bacterium]|jgi:hypothetical protein|nr:toprim domain-containing protein [Acidimicrobiales bacterium]
MYDRDALIAAVDLPALADELLGPHTGTARAPMWRCPEPQHAQTGRTPPVSIFTSGRGEQRWRCHGCGAGGTAIDLVMVFCRTDLRDALEFLARRVGQEPQAPGWSPRPRPRHSPLAAVGVPVGCRDQAGLDRYVEECAHRLFSPAGQHLLRWLTDERGLPPPVLEANRVGADLGPGRQDRPDGMPRASGVVLPVLVDGHAVYAQIRVPHPRPDRPRYLNPRAGLAPNPRLARVRPVEQKRQAIIITEGAIDALSAASAGFRAVAVLSAAYPDRLVAHELSRLPDPLVIAFDQDDAGRAAAGRLTALLDAHQRHPANLVLSAGDVNEALVRSSNWTKELELRVNAALGQFGASRALEVG